MNENSSNVRDVAWELYERLKTRSIDHAERWKVLYIDVRDRFGNGALPSVDTQIEEINRYWHMELGMSTVDTRQIRSCLVSTVNADTWLANFEKYVLDNILKVPTPSGPWSAVRCA